MNPFQVVRDFERALCEYTGAPYAVTTTSCTMALLLAVAWYLRAQPRAAMQNDPQTVYAIARPTVEIPKHTYVGVPYAIQEAGGRPTFRDENWGARGFYRLWPLPIWDCARLFTGRMYTQCAEGAECHSNMLCVSFHWSKTLGIQQGGAILHDNPAADEWLRRARFDGRAEGVVPSKDTFPLSRAWHAYMSPETAAAGLVRLANLPRNNDPIPADDYPDLSEMAVFRNP